MEIIVPLHEYIYKALKLKLGGFSLNSAQEEVFRGIKVRQAASKTLNRTEG